MEILALTGSKRDWAEEWEVAKARPLAKAIKDSGAEQEATFSLILKEDRLLFIRDLGNMEVIGSIKIDQAI